jgi:hypothetical protein
VIGETINVAILILLLVLVIGDGCKRDARR